MPHMAACPTCLRRSWLLSDLGSYMEHRAGADRHVAIWLSGLDDEDLIEAVAPAIGEQVIARLDALTEDWFAAKLEEAGCWAVCRHVKGYPIGLRDNAVASPALIGRGDPMLLDDIVPEAAVTIVGSRRASVYGSEVAGDLGRQLADVGFAVVSGLDFGVDADALRGALDVGGMTVAVLPGGPDVPYPAAHRSLWRRITEKGVAVSELPPDSVPWRWTFPVRDRLMAALTGMTIVVEAAACSASPTTSRLAADLGREVGAVPGPITSKTSAATNELIAGGAHVVRQSRDVLTAMFGA